VCICGAAEDQRLFRNVVKCVSFLVISSLCLISLGLFYILVEGLPSVRDYGFQFILTWSFISVDRDVQLWYQSFSLSVTFIYFT